ncbi:hypothetical protein, partial [Phenylobacterium sp.]|uniref:hypothetical protein n=1 Tax=Phenylobacterium sp. TaxID=1871053 RepID=UPI0025F00A85
LAGLDPVRIVRHERKKNIRLRAESKLFFAFFLLVMAGRVPAIQTRGRNGRAHGLAIGASGSPGQARG